MTTGPDYLRIGDTERDAMAESLHEHFVQGRLNREELDERLTAALTAKTAGDLREIDQDLPRPPAAYAPDTTPGQRGGPPWAAHHRLARRGDLPLGHHRHGPRPLRLLLAAALLVVIATAAGTGGMVFAVVRVFFVVWLVMAVVGLVQGRRWRRMNRPHR